MGTPTPGFERDSEVSEMRGLVRAVSGANGPYREWRLLRAAANERKLGRLEHARQLIVSSRKERWHREDRQIFSGTLTFNRKSLLSPCITNLNAVVFMDGIRKPAPICEVAA